MAGVFQNIDPPPPFGAGGEVTHSLSGEGGRGSIFWKTSDTALYSMYVSTYFVGIGMDREKIYFSIEHRAGRAAHLASWRNMTQPVRVLLVMVALEGVPCVRIFLGMNLGQLEYTFNVITQPTVTS
jgi:hypothetical protein